jgi:hypothetical protein
LNSVNNRPAYNAGRLGNALKGHFSRGTTVPVFTVFMDPSPKARVFMKTIKSILNLFSLEDANNAKQQRHLKYFYDAPAISLRT